MIERCNTRRRRTVSRGAGALLCVGTALVLGGCPPPIRERPAPPPLRPLPEAVEAVNANYAAVGGGLASRLIELSADFVDEEGRRRHFDLGGQMRFVPPRFLYLDLGHSLEASVVHVGSNEERFWVWVKPQRQQLWWGWWGDVDACEPGEIALRPDALLPAMGLAPLPEGAEELIGPVRQGGPEGEAYDKLLYVARADGRGWIQREYWLDRYEPFLPRVILFRDPAGQVILRSELDDYRPVAGSAFHMARSIRIESRGTDSRLAMKIRSLSFKEMRADSPAFQLDPRRVPIPQERWVQIGRRHDALKETRATACEPAPALESSPE